MSDVSISFSAWETLPEDEPPLCIAVRCGRFSRRFGTTHFCAACHDDFQRLVCLPRNQFPPCPAGPRATPAEGPCPLRQPHPPPGEEFALGCGICRNISTF
ncbi:hypothetical protein RB195_015193 [Necator americanus]|uniref:Uncharacterized protein n=1 Tax=Necator americanus TaxID=51031 RepID=A0ABR1E564_NECAM